MKRKRKEELAEYFKAPIPEKKRTFTRQLGMQKINLLHVVIMQARYISKGVWIFSVVFFGITFLLAQTTEPRYIGMVVSFIPFLVMLSVTESMRSYRYHMEELELSTRFCLKSIVLARMVMLGLVNFMVLAGVIFILKSQMQISIAYVMTPYFLTAGGSLCIVRNLRGKESTLLCFGLAFLVCVMEVYLPWRFKDIFEPQLAWVWVCTCFISIFVTVRESYRMIQITEDLAWN